MNRNFLYLPFLPLAVLIIAFATGCEKDEGFTETAPQIPSPIFIDLNDDGTSDYQISSGEGVWDGENSSGSVFGGNINPLNDNNILDSISSFFGLSHTSAPGAVLSAEAEAPLHWDSFRGGPELVQIFSQGTSPDTWPTTWTRTYGSGNAEVFMGLKLAHDPGVTPTLGWVKLSVNASSGKITVLNKGFVVANELVIEE
jgi:hypothetical protein